MERKELVLTQEQQGLLSLIDNVQNNWAEYELEDLPLFEHFNRKLVVVGFSATPTENFTKEMFSVRIAQVLTNKDTGEVYKKKVEDEWFIYPQNKTVLTNEKGEPIKVVQKTLDENNEVIEEKEVTLDAPSIKYIKFLLLNKKAHLVDVLSQFMGLYYEKFKTKIDMI